MISNTCCSKISKTMLSEVKTVIILGRPADFKRARRELMRY